MTSEDQTTAAPSRPRFDPPATTAALIVEGVMGALRGMLPALALSVEQDVIAARSDVEIEIESPAIATRLAEAKSIGYLQGRDDALGAIKYAIDCVEKRADGTPYSQLGWMVWRSWSEAMIAQGRHVDVAREEFATLDPIDVTLDNRIALALGEWLIEAIKEV